MNNLQVKEIFKNMLILTIKGFEISKFSWKKSSMLK